MLFFESKDTEVFMADRNKLVPSSEKQTDKFIPYCLTCFTQTCQLCVSTIVKVSFMKSIFLCGCCSFLNFVAKKGRKDTELQLLCTQGTLQGGRVEEHRLMFIRHLHSPQLYIQAILYIYKTDSMMSLERYEIERYFINHLCSHRLNYGIFTNTDDNKRENNKKNFTSYRHG